MSGYIVKPGQGGGKAWWPEQRGKRNGLSPFYLRVRDPARNLRMQHFYKRVFNECISEVSFAAGTELINYDNDLIMFHAAI
jgi:hypothetical protein